MRHLTGLMSRVVSGLLAVAAVLVLRAPTASASPTFPGVVQGELALAAAPECTLCHTTPSGGFGTANTAFATYMRSRGLRAGDAGSLRGALAASTAERRDSDNDGVSDLDELKRGADPNAAGADAVEPPAYGCGGRVAAREVPRRAMFPVLLTVMLLALVTRRRAPREPYV